MNDVGGFQIDEILILPLVIGLVQLAKRFFPNAPANVWLACSVAFAIGLFFLHSVVMTPMPWLPGTWENNVIEGLAFGLAASKAWDEAIKPLVERQ